MRRSAAAAFLVSCGLVLGGLRLAPAAEAQTEAPVSLLRGFAALNTVATTLTEEAALQVARDYDVVSAQAHQVNQWLPRMKEVNPRLVVLAYLNGAFAQKRQATAYPDSWYLRDASGAKVVSNGWGNYLMNPIEPGWIDDRVALCNSILGTSGYDGCFVDMLGPAPLEPGYASGLPIDPRTGAVWTKVDWLAATSTIESRIAGSLGDRPVIGNGLADGLRYFDPTAPTSVLVEPGDGALAEQWLRRPSSAVTAYRSVGDWRRDVDLVADVEARGRQALVMVKLFTTATAAQKEAWRRYSLASFLLATSGRSAFSFVTDQNVAAPPFDRSGTAIGEPTGPYTTSGGLYVRTFSAGLAVVNPSDTTQTAPVEGSFRTLDGAVVEGSLTLPPRSGEVLTRSSAPSTTTSEVTTTTTIPDEPTTTTTTIPDEPTTTTTAAPTTTTTAAPTTTTTTAAPTTTTTAAPMTTTTTTAAPTTTTTTARPVISLQATKVKVKGGTTVELSWSGAPTATVEVVRNGSTIATPSNTGSYSDLVKGRAGTRFTYVVCTPGRVDCSNSVTVTL